MQDALRTQAERTPGLFVEGWTERPTLTADTRPIWQSYAEFTAWGEQTPEAVARWVDRKHWREDAEGRALLFDVFLELTADRIRSTVPPPAEEPQRD